MFYIEIVVNYNFLKITRQPQKAAAQIFNVIFKSHRQIHVMMIEMNLLHAIDITSDF